MRHKENATNLLTIEVPSHKTTRQFEHLNIRAQTSTRSAQCMMSRVFHMSHIYVRIFSKKNVARHPTHGEANRNH